jgi:hypothetical protein
VPDAVLNKPGKLTDEEYDIIKTHPAPPAPPHDPTARKPGPAGG